MAAITRTSKEWLENEFKGVKVIDPDGWDRSSIETYEYTFNIQKITIDRFVMRLMQSTIESSIPITDIYAKVSAEKWREL